MNFLGVSGMRNPYPHEAQTSEAIAARIFKLFGRSSVNHAVVTRLSSKLRLLSLVASGQPLMLLPAVIEIR